MGLSTAERNRRKRDRKKRDKEVQRQLDEVQSTVHDSGSDEPFDVEVVYVAEPLAVNSGGEEFEPLRLWKEHYDAVVTDDENKSDDRYDQRNIGDERDDNDIDHDAKGGISKRKMREILRPSVAELKRKVQRPDLVEAHDVTAEFPEFLIRLKAVPGTVPVPRHWGRKRKYLQGKRGFEKPPFVLPDFITKTGITEIRDTVATEEDNMSVRQKNRQRVAPKMGAIDVDYRTLHDAFFKYQTKPSGLTKFGDLYYEGKEMEMKPNNLKLGMPLSKALRDALDMTLPSSPPPWLVNMQRYGPPPSCHGIAIPGLNAPLPSIECQYGFHPGGWGKPPIDNYGRPLYGGNPFDPPGSKFRVDVMDSHSLVTSDGKTVAKSEWGALPTGILEDVEDDESSADDMEASSSEDEDEVSVVENEEDDIERTLLDLSNNAIAIPSVNLRKVEAGDETPLTHGEPKQLYRIIEQKKTVADPNAVFASEMAYVVPGSRQAVTSVPEGAESVLSKVISSKQSSKSRRNEDDDEEDLAKNFKF